MQILAIERVPGPAERVVMRLDGGEEVELPLEVVLRRGLGAGDVLSEEAVAGLHADDVRWRAKEAALRLLAHRPRTQAELRQRLRQKGFDAAVAEECVAGLSERGLLDDAAFAELFARDRVRLSPRGKRRVVQELRGRGVDAEVADRAVQSVLQAEQTDELTLARQAARRWRARDGEEPARARRRLAGYLARRGFGGETVRDIVEELLGAE